MLQILKSPNLCHFQNLIHGFTTRELGNDYDLISQQLKVLPSQIYTLKQIHSNRVVHVEHGMGLADFPEGDALVTDRRDIIIGVKTADCVPLLFYDCEREVIAAVHAGYRGILKGVIQQSVKMMLHEFQCREENIYVSLGPAISVASYEVGDEVIEEFSHQYGDRFVFQRSEGFEKPHLDLKETIKFILKDLGLDILHVTDMQLCTYSRADLFYSYRREKSVGRQFSFIGMES